MSLYDDVLECPNCKCRSFEEKRTYALDVTKNSFEGGITKYTPIEPKITLTCTKCGKEVLKFSDSYMRIFTDENRL